MTLDELIEEQLKLGKKLGEIKLRCPNWAGADYFIPYFRSNSLDWHGLNQYDEYRAYDYHLYKAWHLYTEPKQKKYWLWYLSIDSSWHMVITFLDENGFDTSGEIIYSEWHDLEKRKVEDAFIEVDSE